MNAYQISVLLFALVTIGLSLWAIFAVARSPHMRFKPLWIAGSLVGFVGLGIDWNTPDDLIMLFGVTVPVVMIVKVLVSGHVYVKTGLPIVAIVALVKSGSRPRSIQPDGASTAHHR